MRRPNALRLLAIYFAIRWDHPVQSPLGRDPSASRVTSGDFSRAIAIACDIGACLEVLTEEQRQAITYYWSLYFSRIEHDSLAAAARAKARVRLRRGDKGGATALLTEAYAHEDDGRRITSELANHRRRKIYVTAMQRLDIELHARDLYARASLGDGAGVQQ